MKLPLSKAYQKYGVFNSEFKKKLERTKRLHYESMFLTSSYQKRI